MSGPFLPGINQSILYIHVMTNVASHMVIDVIVWGVPQGLEALVSCF